MSLFYRIKKNLKCAYCLKKSINILTPQMFPCKPNSRTTNHMSFIGDWPIRRNLKKDPKEDRSSAVFSIHQRPFDLRCLYNRAVHI